MGATQLRSGAVTSAKIRDGAIRKADLATAVLATGRGPRGPEGPPGTQGQRGPAGNGEIVVRKRDAAVNVGFDAGATVEVARFSLPAGKWFVQAITNAINAGQGTFFRCGLLADGTELGLVQAVFVGGSAGAAVRVSAIRAENLDVRDL